MAEANVKSTRAVTIVGAICALIAVIGVFLTWMDVSVLGSTLTSYSGWDLYSNDLFGSLDYNYAGLAVVVCGVLSLIFMIVCACYKNGSAGMGLQVLTIILSLIGLIINALAIGPIGDFGILGTTSVGYGAYVSLVFMVLTFLLAIAGTYLEHKNETA